MTAAPPPAIRRPALLRACRWSAVACAAVLLVASILPSDPQATGIWAWDHSLTPQTQNVLHVPAYAALAGLMTWGWWRQAMRPGRWAMIFVVSSVYGAALECAQAVIPGRCGSLSDAWLNVVGAGAGVALALLTGRAVLRDSRSSAGSGVG